MSINDCLRLMTNKSAGQDFKPLGWEWLNDLAELSIEEAEQSEHDNDEEE